MHFSIFISANPGSYLTFTGFVGYYESYMSCISWEMRYRFGKVTLFCQGRKVVVYGFDPVYRS